MIVQGVGDRPSATRRWSSSLVIVAVIAICVLVTVAVTLELTQA